jgi:hypothetical protein
MGVTMKMCCLLGCGAVSGSYFNISKNVAVDYNYDLLFVSIMLHVSAISTDHHQVYKYVFNTQICVQVEYTKYASSQILQSCFPLRQH